MKLHHDIESRHRADRRQRAEPHHLRVLRLRYGVPEHLLELVATLPGIGPVEGR